MTKLERVYEKRFYDVMRNNNLHGDVVATEDNSLGLIKVEVTIHWGDWKHDHAALNHVINTEFNPTDYYQETIEEDGSDCYSAIHTYIFEGAAEKKPLVFELQEE